jgi:hypothetical protein
MLLDIIYAEVYKKWATNSCTPAVPVVVSYAEVYKKLAKNSHAAAVPVVVWFTGGIDKISMHQEWMYQWCTYCYTVPPLQLVVRLPIILITVCLTRSGPTRDIPILVASLPPLNATFYNMQKFPRSAQQIPTQQ